MVQRVFLTGVVLFSLSFSIQSQDKTVVVIGSSTALGNKAFPSSDSSYVGRMRAAFRKNTQDAKDTTVELLAHTGYNTYNAMPDDYVLPAGREDIDIDETRNITRALSFSPDVVIINFPSNDPNLPNYTLAETLHNFRLMYQWVTATGAKCYITTAQPRDDFNAAKRDLLKKTTDSVLAIFGLYSLNFWDDLVRTDGSYLRMPEVAAENDGIHVNNLGHRLLFERIMAKNIFNPVEETPLPVLLSDFTAVFRKNVVKVSWTAEMEEPETVYELQRSDDGVAFATIFLQPGNANAGQKKDYFVTDPAPLQGKSFYRLKIREPEGTRHSPTASILRPDKNPFINKVYISRGDILIEMNNPKKQRVAVRVLDQQGAAILQAKYDLVREKSEIRIPFSSVSNAGVYIVTVTTPDGNVYVNRFVKPN